MKTQIRKQIERILDRKFHCSFTDPTSKTKKKYRLKLCTDTPATKRQLEQIKQLPHVVGAGYWKSKCWYSDAFCGIVIYFNCKPSQIKLS